MSKYVVVLKRAIPVEGCLTDTVTGVFNEKAPLGEIMKWADMHDRGSVTLISVEITKPEVVSDER
jgi:hypothetical protein